MKKIASFEVNHDKLEKGMYISRIDGDIITYDIRMVKPNTPPFLDSAAAHSFEHLLATFLRNSKYSEKVIYAGPMGCLTGFYVLFRNLDKKDAIKIIKESMDYIANFEGTLPGNTAKECGNYLHHNLEKAKKYAKDMSFILKDWNEDKLNYN